MESTQVVREPPEEIADDLIEQLARAFQEVADEITVDDLHAAFERKFGPFISAARQHGQQSALEAKMQAKEGAMSPSQ
jgi:hypothetical protein